jgi:TPR repeat protein
MERAPAKLILAVILPAVGIIFLVLACGQLTLQKSQIEKAKTLLKEFKTAKALEELNLAKKLSPGPNQDLDFFIFYAYVKAKQYDKAAEILRSLKSIPKSYSEEFKYLIELLNVDNQSQMIIESINKSDHLKLDEEFFMTLSKKCGSIDSELKVLEKGLEYLKRNKSKSSDLETYLLDRYIEIANVYSGSNQYKTAISYLLQATSLSVFNSSSFKDDLYLNLALAYKGAGDYNKAWEYVKKSAELGNEMARHQLLELNH